MGRKAQVTVFIILGIVLMGIFGAVLFITNSSTKGDFETQAAPVSESVPQEFTALQQFVESCIYSIGKKGITGSKPINSEWNGLGQENSQQRCEKRS